jgi:predicted nucleic acid-binding protein
LALTAAYLADKSALARLSLPAVASRVVPLLEDGLIASCSIIDLEVLYSARSQADYEEVLEERRSLDSAPITPEVMDTAIELQHALARRGQHRIPIPDLVISAAAKHAHLVVLHYDDDFARIRDAGGARHEWVVPQGTI